MSHDGAAPRPNPKKHPCPDCAACQFCSDRRCDLCRGWLCRRDKAPARDEPPEGKDDHGTEGH